MGGFDEDDDEDSEDEGSTFPTMTSGLSSGKENTMLGGNKTFGDRGNEKVIGDAFVPPRGSAYVGRGLSNKVSMRSSGKSGAGVRTSSRIESKRYSSQKPSTGMWSETMTLSSIEDETLDLSIDDRKDISGVGDDGDGGGFDIPTRLTIGPNAKAARLDLQRCTIQVHKQLKEQLGRESMHPGKLHGEERDSMGQLSRAQGELFLKSRIPMMGWRRRYGSIVDHSYFGPVLFLFKYDSDGDVALHHSMMIVLVESQVRLGKNSLNEKGDHRCEFHLTTSRRKYRLSTAHTKDRDNWLKNLLDLQEQTNR